MSSSLNSAIHRFMAQSRRALLGLQPEDWLEMATPVNVPSTTDAYPNWRRKLARDLETMFSDPDIIRLLTAVGDGRRLALAPALGRSTKRAQDDNDDRPG
ncbi:MAG: 4-alpha-glucanotransferase [Sodalis sp. (in: enterobacteria)]|uniref:4-alpha-glucanotransferase n=1 Tax=Sodalis sp. (in: enterobacteria) TaxID=1898979 RepID=UPI003F40C0D0